METFVLRAECRVMSDSSKCEYIVLGKYHYVYINTCWSKAVLLLGTKNVSDVEVEDGVSFFKYKAPEPLNWNEIFQIEEVD